jgi:site-specific recombinase XerD
MLAGFIIIAKKTVGHFFRFAVRSTDECRMFFRWLARQNHILSNPASELELSRREKRLPKHVLTISEAEAIINQSQPKRTSRCA